MSVLSRHMKRQSVMKACMFGILLSLALTAHADEPARNLAGTLTKFANQKLAEPGRPVWLKRTSVKFGVADRQPTWMIKTLQPVRQSNNETLFLQGRLRQDSESAVSNIGSAYRWRTADNAWALGLNGFYDQDFQSSAERFSIGAEAFSRSTSVRANLYSAIDSPVANSDRLALDGFDLKLETPAPFLRQTHLSIKTYQWNESTNGEPEQGWRAALKTSPSHSLSMELGAGRSPLKEAELFMNLTYHFGQRSKRKTAVTDRLAPQHNHIVREYNLLAGNS